MKDTWSFYNPVHVQFGNGSFNTLKKFIGERKAILVTFPEAKEHGIIQRVKDLLGDCLIGVEDNVAPNPDVSWLTPMYERCIKKYSEAEIIIALGGGSVIDCAKALITQTPSGTFNELLEALEKGTDVPYLSTKELITLPTTSGTGSEVTPWATIWDEVRGKKYSLHLPWTWSKYAIIDPELMLSLPASPTLAGGLDALSHALESLWNVHRTPISTTFAKEAISLILETLPQLMKNLQSLSLRENMALAALKAGWAFSQTKTALAHSISYEFTLNQQVPHGIACSFSLPTVMSLAFGSDKNLNRILLDLFEALSIEEATQTLKTFIENLGVPTSPSAYGVNFEEWNILVNQALQGPRGQNFIGSKTTTLLPEKQL